MKGYTIKWTRINPHCSQFAIFQKKNDETIVTKVLQINTMYMHVQWLPVSCMLTMQCLWLQHLIHCVGHVRTGEVS